jgi:hypothetical protein
VIEGVLQLAGKGVAPHVKAIRRLDELRRDADLVALLAHAALRAGFITDCVLSASLAKRLLSLRKLAAVANGLSSRSNKK